MSTLGTLSSSWDITRNKWLLADVPTLRSGTPQGQALAAK